MIERTLHIGCTNAYYLREGDVVTLIDDNGFEVRTVVTGFSVFEDGRNCKSCALNHSRVCRSADIRGDYLCRCVSSNGRYLFVPVGKVMEEL